MCTLITIHRGIPGRWLVVAANRDEFLDRPALGPAVRRGPAGPILAPLDARAGGTWLGLNAHGVFAALTNLRDGEPDPTRKSRGMVVMDALALRSADAAAGALARLPEASFNAFNCFVADGEAAYLITYRERAAVHPLAPGVHVIGNADASAALRTGNRRDGPAAAARSDRAVAAAVGERSDNDRQRKVERVLARARAAAALPPGDVLDALARLCAEHGTGQTGLDDTSVRLDDTSVRLDDTCVRLDDTCVRLDDTCVHVADTYGTRSSLLLELADTPDSSRLLYAEGAPCRAPYRDFSSLLTELRQAPGYGSAEASTRTVR